MLRAIAAHPRGQWPEDGMVDKVTLAYLDRHRRRIRLVADSGAAFLLDLSRAQRLADGDGLELDSGGYIRVCAAPEPVLEIAAADRDSLLRIAWHLRNRHLPLPVTGGRLRIREYHVRSEMRSGRGGGGGAGCGEGVGIANGRGLGFRATWEMAVETTAQGDAFLATCRAAWPDPFLDRWALMLGEAGDAVCHPAAVGAVIARAGI